MSHTRALMPLVAMLAAAAGGCHSPLARSVPEADLRASGEYRIVGGLDVPPVRGPAGCGAQALATVLARGEPPPAAETLAGELPWQDLGATPVDLLLGARGRGFDAVVSRGTWDALAAQVERDVPVLVMIDSAYEVRTLVMRYPLPRVMHWGVVAGMALDGSRVLIATRDRRHHVVGQDEFLKRWGRSDNCMIVVTRPP